MQVYLSCKSIIRVGGVFLVVLVGVGGEGGDGQCCGRHPGQSDLNILK